MHLKQIKICIYNIYNMKIWKKNTNIWKEYAKRAIILEIYYIDINKDDFS